ncbi:MAG TPA: RNA polymerase sigma factor [Allosphingosinicella sp.]|jgi:RNA polymerase sigma-70 factor (ECF subfamily)|nr:RNA polymerase sigma factor [Allosphingosinicella sp.]
MSGDKEAERALDAWLAAAARTGDARAFALLVKRWHPRLTAHAWRLLGDSDAARDAAQDAWAEIVRSLPRLDDLSAFGAWAYRIVSRRCAKAIGGAVRRRRLAESVAAEPPPAAAEDASDAGRLRAAIAALPPEQRAAVALFHFEEMSVAETAVALNVPAGTVKTRLMHARRKLRALLEGVE